MESKIDLENILRLTGLSPELENQEKLLAQIQKIIQHFKSIETYQTESIEPFYSPIYDYTEQFLKTVETDNIDQSKTEKNKKILAKLGLTKEGLVKY